MQLTKRKKAYKGFSDLKVFFDSDYWFILLNMDRRRLYWLMGIVLALMVLNACSSEQAHDKTHQTARPNIILIMADDLGMETLSSYGGESYHTPNLDQLAAGGMQFQNCYSTPLCTPSRVQIMTGKYNFRNYIGFGLLDSTEQTFGHVLQQAGYATGIAGKWQLYGNQRQQELAGGRTGSLPLQAGFDAYRLWQVKDRGWRYKTPTVETYKEGLETFESGYGPDTFVEFIEEFMTDNRERPFLVYYPMCLVHDPFLTTPDSPDFKDYDPELNLNDTTYFGDMMSYLDKIVGRIVKKVDDLGIRENTIIMFTGDNGTDRKVVSKWNGESVPGGKGYPVETGTHVPLLVNWQGTITPGQKNENLVDFTDFLPTIIDLAGISQLEAAVRDGVSFYSQLLGRSGPVREWVFGHYQPEWGKFPNKRYVHNTEWKLYGNGDFFRIANDREELDTLDVNQLSQEQVQVRDQFQSVLSRMKEEINHSFFVAGPSFTGIIDESGKIAWNADRPAARDGYVLPNGNVLICWEDQVIEYNRKKEVQFRYDRSAINKELGTAVRLPNGNTLISELGVRPRLLEVNPDGGVEVEVPLVPETDNIHMQTRMARKLDNGNYLVPHLLAFAVKEYSPSGEVLQVIKTDLGALGGREAENWPFTAIRLENGNTLISLTHGNKVIEVDPTGTVIWQMGNEDVDGEIFQDPCGAQRLPNGNTVIASYGATEGVKLFETTPEKEVVWRYSGEHRVHHFQILTTNGRPVGGKPLK